MAAPPTLHGRQVLGSEAAHPWARLSGGARAVRQGSRIVVSGTQARDAEGRILAPGDAQAQTTLVLEQIAASLRALGSGLQDVVRTRVLLRDPDASAGPAEAHARAFAGLHPATSLQGAPWLPAGCEVEIEAEAEVPPAARHFISTGTASVAGSARIASSTSSPEQPGSIRSRITRSCRASRTACAAPIPSAMVDTCQPSRLRMNRIASAILGSSSISRTWLAIPLPPLFGHGASAARLSSGLVQRCAIPRPVSKAIHPQPKLITPPHP